MLSLSCLCFLSFQVLYAQESAGSLVIVGGGLEAGNQRIYSSLIALAGGKEHARFAVIPSASGVAMQSFVWFRNTLVTYGVKPENILLIEVAEVDDDSTTQVDESTWSNNGDKPDLADRVRSCSAVWFTGGDQLRTTRTLYRKDGSRSSLLDAVWEVYRKGGVVGGTSAGAAIMCDPMIGDGTSLEAILQGVTETPAGTDPEKLNGVLITKGIGFFPAGLVDQHFEVRARIGRLLVALLHLRDRYSRGFGIDENTALIYDGITQTVEVAGASGVTIVDVSGVEDGLKPTSAIRNIRIDYLMDGDRFDPETGIVMPASGRIPMDEKSLSPNQRRASGGIFAEEPGIREMMISALQGKNSQNLTFTDEKSAIRIGFRKKPESKAYIQEQNEPGNRYTLENFRLDLDLVTIEIIPFE